MNIEMEALSKRYDAVTAVDRVSLTVEDGSLLALLGPSGCGKTTLLRMVAGLIPVTEGRLSFGGRDVTDLPAQQRNTAMVFQNYALFPNMTVAENVAFGLKVRKTSRQEQRRRVEEMLSCVELEGLGNRRIQELSGGQRQRVALARALVIEPDILLFDEPLSNLDQKLRVSMRQTIKRLQREFGITSLYVTHDQEEAMSIADRIAVMDHGVLQQVDVPQALYFAPCNPFVADFIGKANLFELSVEGGTVTLLGRQVPTPSGATGTVRAMLRPERLFFSDEGVEGTVIFAEVLGLITRYHIQWEGRELLLDDVSQAGGRVRQVGERVRFTFAPESLYFLPEAAE